MGLPEGPAARSRSLVGCALALALCALAAALAALAVILAKQPQPLPPWPSASPSVLPPPTWLSRQWDDQQNYAQLVLNLRGNSAITERMLDWSIPPVKGAYLGWMFAYSNSRKLTVKVAGLYCVYAQMNLTHRLGSMKEEINANLTIYRVAASSSDSSSVLLNLPLHRFYNSKQTLHDFRAVLHQLAENDTLYVKIHAKSKQNGSLEPRGSFFGLFQIQET